MAEGPYLQLSWVRWLSVVLDVGGGGSQPLSRLPCCLSIDLITNLIYHGEKAVCELNKAISKSN